MDNETDVRIAKLENGLMQLAQQVVTVTTTTVAQAYIIRAALDISADRDGPTLDEIRERTLMMLGSAMPEIRNAVQTILSEVPAELGRAQ